METTAENFFGGLFGAILSSSIGPIDRGSITSKHVPSILSAEVHDDTPIVESLQRQIVTPRSTGRLSVRTPEEGQAREVTETTDPVGDGSRAPKGLRRQSPSGEEIAPKRKPRGRPRLEVRDDTAVDVCLRSAV